MSKAEFSYLQSLKKKKEKKTSKNHAWKKRSIWKIPVLISVIFCPK